MIGYLIKNNFKLMLRSRWSLVIMLAGPLLVIAALSSAFSYLLQVYEVSEDFPAGYRMTAANQQEVSGSEIKELLRSAGEEAGILFTEYPEGEIEELMEKNDLAGFVDFTEDVYVIYCSGDYEAEGMVLEYFVHRMMSAGADAALQAEGELCLAAEELEFMPAVDSSDYYGIIEIVYFSWCGLVCAAGILSSEKKYGIGKRFRVAGISEISNYLAKLIALTGAAGGGMAAAAVLSVLLFDIHWGKPLVSACVVLLTILAGNAFGLMLYSFFRNLAIAVIMEFTTVWIMGFLGGSFETYMYSAIAENLKRLSPIYHSNRALVELSCMGKSDYTASALCFCAVITVVCSVLAVLAERIRKRGKA